eukprot:scaffold566_cov364-Pavlova_lutheri.AAC.36
MGRTRLVAEPNGSSPHSAHGNVAPREFARNGCSGAAGARAEACSHVGLVSSRERETCRTSRTKPFGRDVRACRSPGDFSAVGSQEDAASKRLVCAVEPPYLSCRKRLGKGDVDRHRAGSLSLPTSMRSWRNLQRHVDDGIERTFATKRWCAMAVAMSLESPRRGSRRRR